MLGHAIGIILGAGGTTLNEVHLNLALKDNILEKTEAALLDANERIVKLGLFLTMITGLGFIGEYWYNDALARFDSGVFLSKIIVFAVIALVAIISYLRFMSWYWQSLVSLISWWFVTVLSVLILGSISIFPGETLLACLSILSVYLLCIGLGVGFLDKIRRPLRKRDSSEVMLINNS